MSLFMAKEWLKATQDDIYLLDDIVYNIHLTNMVAFHAQQAIEKSLKSIIELNDIEIPRVHSLNKLFNIIEQYIDIEVDIELINKLDKLYIDSRYPGDIGLLPYGKPTIDDAKQFYEFANSVFDRVCKILDIDKREVMR